MNNNIIYIDPEETTLTKTTYPELYKLITNKGTIPKILESTIAEIDNVYFDKIIEENHKYHVMFYDKITNGDIYFEIDMKDIKKSLLDINNKIKIWKQLKN